MSCDGKIKPPGGRLFETDLITISHSVPPAQNKGFMIVQPKRHVEHIAELTKEEMSDLSQAIHNTAKAITKALKPEKVYVCSFGETVKHVHFHVLPRYSNMPKRGITVLTQILDQGLYRPTQQEAEEAARQVKKELLKLYKAR